MWSIVLDTHGEKYVFADNLSREDALQLIETHFESGNLSRQVYRKITVNLWQHNSSMFLHLIKAK